MAKFHSLSPPLGTHHSRLAPDLFSIELSLALPQDHFLPAEGIQAQVWTNIIHQRNPEGPQEWAPMSMKLSQVIPGTSIAVFTTRVQPTGRGDFGLTCRWKSHKDQDHWQWASEGIDAQNVSITVRVPRSISSSSSWTLGPQSVLVYGKDGPREEGRGGRGVGGPGLYLGNHAAATRARIAGYEAVLSLVGDLLDFDEKIPETDKDLNKNVWKEQQQQQQANPRLSSLSRSSSITVYGASLAEIALKDDPGQEEGSRLRRRSSVTDFMVNYTPGSSTGPDMSGLVEEPIDGPRLSRTSSVTEMMVQPPSSAGSRRMRSSASVSSIASIGEVEPEPEEVIPPFKPTSAKGKKAAAAANAASASAVLPPAPMASTGPPVSKKGAQKAAALPPVSSSTTATPSSGKGSAASKTTPAQSSTTQAVSPTVQSLSISNPISDSKDLSNLRLDSGSSTLSNNSFTNTLASANPDEPPSSAKVVSGLYRQSYESHQALSSLNALSNDMAQENAKKANGSTLPAAQPAAIQPAKPFQHKVISLAPGAHNRISEAVLKEAVEFLRNEIAQDKKVLVHCRDGNGRSGSIALAYIMAQSQRAATGGDTKAALTFDQALQEIWKWKCDVYPHHGLRQSLESVQWK